MTKKLMSLILCIIMLLTASVGCTDTENSDTDATSTTTAKTSVTTAETTVETTAETTVETASVTGSETVAGTEAPDPEPSADYEWVIEAGKFGDDIQPVYDLWNRITQFGLMQLNNQYLIDFEGNIKAIAPDTNTGNDLVSKYCNMCKSIGLSSDVSIDPHTYEATMLKGHGFEHLPNYIYDPGDNSIFYYSYGKCITVTENISYSVVTLGKKSTSDSDYETEDRYGIVINSKLVVPFEYDSFMSYESGIAALRKNGKWAYFDTTGKMILNNDYSAAAREQLPYTTDRGEYIPYGASSGYIALNRDGKWGYADTDGNIVIDFIFEEARPVYCGKAWVKTEDGWGVIKIDEPEILTEEEAKKIVYDDSCETYGYLGIHSMEVVPNGKNFYESVGYGFDINITTKEGQTLTYETFIDYTGFTLLLNHNSK